MRSSAGVDLAAGSRIFWMREGCYRAGRISKNAGTRKLCGSGARKMESSFHSHKPFI
jgi:hypothetical protein